MTSNLACIGLDVTDSAALNRLVNSARGDAQRLGEANGVTVLRWQDPSRAGLIMEIVGDKVVDLLPLYTGIPGAHLRDIHAVNDDVVFAEIVDEQDDQIGALTAELAQRRLLSTATEPVSGLASVVALGIDVNVHADVESFIASDDSLLNSDGDTQAEPPPHFVENGWPWPPRMAPESFISYGAFAQGDEAQAYALLNGTVLSAEQHVVALTGQQFIAARVRTAGFDVDLCMPAQSIPFPLHPGNILSGTVFLVASLEIY